MVKLRSSHLPYLPSSEVAELTQNPPSTNPFQFPDLFIIRLLLRLTVLFFNLVGPLCILWTGLSVLTYPAPPVVIFFPPERTIQSLFEFDEPFRWFSWYCRLESVWVILHYLTTLLTSWGWYELAHFRSQSKQDSKLSTEERWRLWIKMLESTEDPWEWLGGAFLAPGCKRAPEGMKDKAITSVQMEEVGKKNVQEYIAQLLFGGPLESLKPTSVERAELRSMFLLLELAITTSRGPSAEPFSFPKTKSRHRVFVMNQQPILTSHHPLLFYSIVWTLIGMGNAALYLAGFRYYGPRQSWPFPLYFMRKSRRALDRLVDPTGVIGKSKEAVLGDKIGYWFHPGSKVAQEEGLTPILFFHGISGTYGPGFMVLLLQWATGRPFFLPEFPYVTMRLSPPSAILARRETVAAAHRMLFRHGFALAELSDGDSDEDDDEWRRGKFVVVAHSLGSAASAWLVRDAPGIVAGLVLVDPMGVWLFAADAPRNFCRTKAKTAGEIFFKYFSSERGISHFFARHMRWSDAVIFASDPVVPLPESARKYIPKLALEPPRDPWWDDDKPNYAPSVSPSPQGPHPTVFFYSELDNVLPVPKIRRYLQGAGFDGSNLHVLPKTDHAAILFRPKWIRRIAEAVGEVAMASEEIEKRRWLEGDD